ncbi:hypothetical protein H6F67_13700 [Microcoleus sp. FACHB-1515]|uniref:tetratricopeptide repeat protein n=1 Tax=Cyanophyceae TaxID=3028117 RepID=UPI0016846AB9|nr:tetratricopeptide repeat protein [Microcoleus sp. FACHB-1515]MBD2090906.1 hypothetical protein [Microcoleus sp. FACHB-1515]
MNYRLLIALSSIAIAVPAQAQSLTEQFAPPRETLTEQLNRQPQTDEISVVLRSIADQNFQYGREEAAVGRFDEAIAAWQQAALDYEQLQDASALGSVYENLATLYTQLGRSLEAEDVLRRRLAIARDTEDELGQIFALNRLAAILLVRGNPGAAQILSLEANRIAQQIGDPAGQGFALSNLGAISLQLGQTEEAIKQLEVAIDFLRRTREAAVAIRARNVLGDAYRTANQPQDALRNYLIALDLSESIDDRASQFRAIDGLIAVYSTLGQPQTALDLLRDRLNLAQANSQQQLNTARLLAEFFVQQGDRAQATLYFQAAIAIARYLEDRQQEGLLVSRQASLGLR